ncbi:MAG: response regulator transcription factor [Flavobacteriales bacterium]|nr:response regulator transcription factor [Flavobacteriales bacterium]
MATSRGSSSVTPKTPARTPVALVASDEVTRRGIRSMLEEIGGYRMAVVVADGSALISACKAGARFQVALVDLVMDDPAGGMPPLRMLNWLHTQRPDVGVVATGAYLADEDQLRMAIKHHASAVLLHGVQRDELARALRDLGESRLHRNAAMDRVIQKDPHPSGTARHVKLSPRQAEILRWWVDPLGYTKPQIAHKMQLGLRTVESHIKAIYKKLKLHNRMQAQRYARHNKLD